jgi:hypothetical protein
LKNTKLVVLMVLVVLLSMLVVSPAWASDGEPHCESGKIFGQHHAEMAQAGLLGEDMNPGMHQGFSSCLP